MKYLRDVIKLFPAVKAHLTGRARWLAYEPTGYKTYDYMLRQIEGLVNGVYSGNVGGEFIDVMANVISGQLTQAYQLAYADEGFGGQLPDYLASSLANATIPFSDKQVLQCSASP